MKRRRNFIITYQIGHGWPDVSHTSTRISTVAIHGNSSSNSSSNSSIVVVVVVEDRVKIAKIIAEIEDFWPVSSLCSLQNKREHVAILGTLRSPPDYFADRRIMGRRPREAGLLNADLSTDEVSRSVQDFTFWRGYCCSRYYIAENFISFPLTRFLLKSDMCVKSYGRKCNLVHFYLVFCKFLAKDAGSGRTPGQGGR